MKFAVTSLAFVLAAAVGSAFAADATPAKPMTAQQTKMSTCSKDAHAKGLKGDEYLGVADCWPHNPKGEIAMGFKLENRHAVENAEQLMAIQGLAFAEPGPSDNSWSILGWDAVKPMSREERAKVLSNPHYLDSLERVRLAAKKNNIMWLGTGTPGATMEQSYDQGMRLIPSPGEEVVHRLREYTKRKMPV